MAFFGSELDEDKITYDELAPSLQDLFDTMNVEKLIKFSLNNGKHGQDLKINKNGNVTFPDDDFRLIKVLPASIEVCELGSTVWLSATAITESDPSTQIIPNRIFLYDEFAKNLYFYQDWDHIWNIRSDPSLSTGSGVEGQVLKLSKTGDTIFGSNYSGAHRIVESDSEFLSELTKGGTPIFPISNYMDPDTILRIYDNSSMIDVAGILNNPNYNTLLTKIAFAGSVLYPIPALATAVNLTFLTPLGEQNVRHVFSSYYDSYTEYLSSTPYNVNEYGTSIDARYGIKFHRTSSGGYTYNNITYSIYQNGVKLVNGNTYNNAVLVKFDFEYDGNLINHYGPSYILNVHIPGSGGVISDSSISTYFDSNYMGRMYTGEDYGGLRFRIYYVDGMTPTDIEDMIKKMDFSSAPVSRTVTLSIEQYLSLTDKRHLYRNISGNEIKIQIAPIDNPADVKWTLSAGFPSFGLVSSFDVDKYIIVQDFIGLESCTDQYIIDYIKNRPLQYKAVSADMSRYWYEGIKYDPTTNTSTSKLYFHPYGTKYYDVLTSII